MWETTNWTLVANLEGHAYTQTGIWNDTITFVPPVFGLWTATHDPSAPSPGVGPREGVASGLAVSAGGDGSLRIWCACVRSSVYVCAIPVYVFVLVKFMGVCTRAHTHPNTHTHTHTTHHAHTFEAHEQGRTI